MQKLAGVGDVAVSGATGMGWSGWLASLDAAGAATMDHKGIVATVGSLRPVSGWWMQMIAVGYEQARGLREPHERTDGFSVSKTRTLSSTLERTFLAGTDASVRSRWLPEEIAISKATAAKSVRGAWSTDGSRLDVYFYQAGAGRTRVQVQHSKLASSTDVQRIRELWAIRLESLEEELKTSAGGWP